MAVSDLGVGGITDAVELGRGATAVVYRAKEVLTGSATRDVAVKVWTVTLSPDDGSQRRFEREVQAMADLGAYAGVVDVYRAGTLADGRPYIVMQFCEGGSVESALATITEWPARQICRFGARIADALAIAHGRSVVHRDIKPDNVLLRGNGDPVIADFGIAVLLQAGVSMSLGFTPDFVAPEVFDQQVIPASDVYSLGVTLFQCFSGALPLELDSSMPLAAYAVALQTRQRLDLRDFGIDGPIADLVGECLAIDPTQRPTARGLADRLAALGVDPPPPPPPPTPGPEPRAQPDAVTAPVAHRPLTNSLGIEGCSNVELVATGGFSRVYRASDDNFRREVAVKVINAVEGEGVDRQAFATECAALGAMAQHPHVVSVHRQGFTIDGEPYLVMDFYKSNLEMRIAEANGSLGEAEVITVGAAVLDALDHAHGQGIVHRDIKPPNILLGEFGPALGDFGIASVQGSSAAASDTALSLHYAAPEVIDHVRHSARSDVYSVGATLFRALSGRRPFELDGANGFDEVARRVRTTAPPVIGRAGVSGDLERLVRQMLSKQPSDRPTAAAAAQQMRAIGDQLRNRGSTPGRPSNAVPPIAEPPNAGPSGTPSPNTVPPVAQPQSAQPRFTQPAAPATGEPAPRGSTPRESAAAPAERLRPPVNRRAVSAVIAIALVLGAVGLWVSQRGGCDELLGECGTQVNENFDDTVDNRDGPVVAARPAAPIGVNVTRLGGDVVVTWTRVANATSYRVDITDGSSMVTNAASLAFSAVSTAETCVRVLAISETQRLSEPSAEACG